MLKQSQEYESRELEMRREQSRRVIAALQSDTQQLQDEVSEMSCIDCIRIFDALDQIVCLTMWMCN